jgi:hypothetical protein
MTATRKPQIHSFESTSEAYDECHWNDDIADGDVLHVPSETVVGILVGAWPTAVTEANGSFHTLADGVTWSTLAPSDFSKLDSYVASRELAQTIMPTDPSLVCLGTYTNHWPTAAGNICRRCDEPMPDAAPDAQLAELDRAAAVDAADDVVALAKLALDGNGFAARKLDELRVAELHTYDAAAFDGDAESGPRAPITSVERIRADVAHLRTTEKLDAALAATMATDDDALFAIAADLSVSPLYVLRRAGATYDVPVTRADEQRFIARMNRESDARRNAESGR